MSGDEDNPGNLGERVAILETNMNWVKDKLDAIDKRTWYTLSSVVIFGIISIIIALIGLMPK